MKKLIALAALSSILSAAFLDAHAQAPVSIEGYWQDIAGRTTFKRDAPPSATYGGWDARELDATYPQAKLIRRSGGSFDLADLNYEEKEWSLKILRAEADGIAYVRKANWSPCRMEHDCRLDGAELACSMQAICQEAGREVVDWKGDERYVRRAY